VLGVPAAAAATFLTLGCGDRPGTGPDAVGEGATVIVTGTVSLGSSTPLPDALVELLTGPQAGGVVTTDADGRFSMPGVPAGIVTLRASKTNYSTAQQSALLVPNANPPFRFSLEPFDPRDVNITGLVTDGNGTGVPGARISINWPVPGSTVSDATGAYSLALTVRPPDPMRPSAWWGPGAVLAEKAGHEPDERYAALAPRTPIDFRLYPIIRLPPGATVRLAVAGIDPYCYEVMRTFNSDPPAWSCRTVRITPPFTGTLTLELEWDNASAVLGLQVRDGRSGWECCDAQQSNRVSAGAELLVDIVLINGRVNRPSPAGSTSFLLKTSLTRE
jgi:hypothetical protein